MCLLIVCVLCTVAYMYWTNVECGDEQVLVCLLVCLVFGNGIEITKVYDWYYGWACVASSLTFRLVERLIVCMVLTLHIINIFRNYKFKNSLYGFTVDFNIGYNSLELMAYRAIIFYWKYLFIIHYYYYILY